MKPHSNNLEISSEFRLDDIYTRNGLTRFMNQAEFHPSRALGQHFLINKKVMRHMLDSIEVSSNDSVIEIGPGLGHLTWQLLQKGATVVAIEKDKIFGNLLSDFARRFHFDPAKLHVVVEDVLEIDLHQLAERYQVSHIVGNLPYNISVPILFRIAYSGYPFRSVNVMVQKEVGERILAEHGTKRYGRLSIVLKYLYSIKRFRTIFPSAFHPIPKVESVVLKMEPNAEIDLAFAQQFLERVVQIGFLHRRKKLRKQLQGSIIQKRVLNEPVMRQIEDSFNLEQRAEEWSIDEWIRFARCIRDLEPTQ